MLNEDAARPSPTKHANLNVVGRHGSRAFTPAGGGLRPPRAPSTAGTDEHEEG